MPAVRMCMRLSHIRARDVREMQVAQGPLLSGVNFGSASSLMAWKVRMWPLQHDTHRTASRSSSSNVMIMSLVFSWSRGATMCPRARRGLKISHGTPAAFVTRWTRHSTRTNVLAVRTSMGHRDIGLGLGLGFGLGLGYTPHYHRGTTHHKPLP